MKRLWAPWRMQYIGGDKPDGCVFCAKLASTNDAENYVLYRGERAALMLNLYPYTNGHILVVPYAHVGDFVALDGETAAEMMRLTQLAVHLLKRACNADGFNIGMNLGESAGAGIQDHVHIHVVPRWENDTNFMPVIADVRVIPQSLDDTYALLCAELGRIKGGAFQAS